MNRHGQAQSKRTKDPANGENPISPSRYQAADAPAVVVLEKANDGLLKIKVESDVMAYILYSHYDDFCRIQQKNRIAITWSGLDNTVMFCLTSQGETSQLHLAAQQFISLYHDIASNLVASLLSEHVKNITLHQYHKATYAVRKIFPGAMIKEVKPTGRVVLYCPVEIIEEAKETFLSALYSTEPFEEFMNSKTSSETTNSFAQSKRKKSKTLSNRKTSDKHSRSFTNENANLNSLKQSEIKSSSTSKCQLEQDCDTSAGEHSSKNNSAFDVINDQNHVTFDERRNAIPRCSEGESSGSNTSSGYGSNNGSQNEKEKFTESNLHILPPIFQQSTYIQSKKAKSLPNSVRRKEHSSQLDFYYDDIQHCGEAVDSGMNGPCRSHAKKSYFNKKISPSFMSSCHTSRSSPSIRTRTLLSPLMQKPTYIPKLESPFRFQQHHRKCFEVITPLGIAVEVHEGDVTDADCEVIVNETNPMLHVTGELAWAVAKHGAFEISKLTKLHVAMNGPVAESKVVVTPSVGLPSLHIIHAVLPKWSPLNEKKSKKLLYNTYKNIFQKASVDLRATSVALPVIGLRKESKSNEAFPYHVATEVMYQSLISFLKVGSSTIRHVRYIDSNPDHVNLIVTSIKPKIENVTYDERFVDQHRLLDTYRESQLYSGTEKHPPKASEKMKSLPPEGSKHSYSVSKTFFDANFS